MVSYFRSFIQKKNNQKLIFVVLIGGSLIYSSISFLFFARRSHNDIAFVNGYPITRDEVQRAIVKLQHFLREYGQPDRGFDYKKKAIEMIAYEKLMEGAVDSLGIHLSSEFISDSLRDPQFIMVYLRSLLPPYLIDPKTGIKEEEFKAFLKASGITLSAFDLLLEKLIKQIVFGELLGTAVSVNQAEIKEHYIKYYTQRKYTLFTKSLKHYMSMAEKEGATPEELRQFFATQLAQGLYHIPEKRTISLWVFDPALYGIVITPEEIKSYEESHKESKDSKDSKAVLREQKFKARFKREAKKALEEGSFEKFATEKKARFGQKNDLVMGSDALSKRVFKLSLHGKDALLDNSQGIVAEVLAIVPAHRAEFESIKKEVATDLYRQKAAALATSDMQKALKDTEYFEKLHFSREEVVVSPVEHKQAAFKKFSKQGIPVERVASLIFPGAAIEGISQDQAYSVRLETLNFNEQDFMQKQKEIEELLAREAFMLAQQRWFIASLARSAKIELPTTQGQTEILELQ